MAETGQGEIDWQATTFEGNRRRQHLQFLALSFREKLVALEALGEVAAYFASRRSAKEGADSGSVSEDFVDQPSR